MDSMAGLSIEERVYWNIREYSNLLKGERRAMETHSIFNASDLVLQDYRNDERGEEERQLQAGVVWKLQEYVFEGCLFQHNQQGTVEEATNFGVVTVGLSYDIGTFENCTFYNNSYGNPDNAVRK